tara:strand:+ start:21324 stop:21446 length:123 start_codon:yes stop_codon:yes gene_type:complete
MNHYNKAIECIECVQQNMNDENFIDWLYKQLGLGLTEAEK